jgi:hypothetical protein
MNMMTVVDLVEGGKIGMGDTYPIIDMEICELTFCTYINDEWVISDQIIAMTEVKRITFEVEF